MMSTSRSIQSHVLGINSVRLDRSNLARILDTLDRTQGDVARNRRQTRRLGYRVRNAIVFPTPEDRTVAFIVPTRNLSAEGMAFLHGQMMHLGKVCTVQLPTRLGGWIRVNATVARCRHVRAMVHEIGVRFEQVIDLQRLTPIGERSKC